MNQDWLAQLPITNIIDYRAVSGGDINDAYKIDTTDHEYFLKVQPNKTADYFDHEKAGLEAIGKVVNVPTPIAQGQIDGDAYLLLNWINSGDGFQSDLGSAVATMHLVHNDKFGFDYNHQSKAVVKNNQWQTSWAKFYSEQRLDMVARLAKEKHVWNATRQAGFDKMRAAFVDYYQTHDVEPSLLHGDLWSGNYMFEADGTPTLIDPDALYGDREYDLAMTTIFGGFDQDFYDSYNQEYPLEPGFQERLPWYQFYYLGFHLVLFGETYGGSVDRILSQY